MQKGRKKINTEETVTVQVGWEIRISKDLTTDPYNKQNQKGVVTAVNKAEQFVTVRFEDGVIGKYSTDNGVFTVVSKN